MGEVIFITILAVIGIIAKAAFSTKTKSGSEQGTAPPRTMSDIQRAFMMMSGLDDESNEEQPRYTPPAAYGEGASEYGYHGAYSAHEGYNSEYDEASEASGSLEGSVSEFSRLSGSLQGDTAIAKEAGYTQYAAVSERMKEAEESIDEKESDGIYGDGLSAETGAKSAARPALKLFADKNEFVRAVIYSEILSRRASRRRLR